MFNPKIKTKMKATKIWAALTAILFFAVACNDDENLTGDYGTIQIANTQLLNQELAADAEGAAGVTFTASESWSATVTETRAVDWITISPDHGEAGTYTLRIELLPNDSTEDRTAIIEIVCGENRVEIRIIQAGEQEESGEETLGERLCSLRCYNLSQDGSAYNEEIWELEYDDEDRLVKVTKYEPRTVEEVAYNEIFSVIDISYPSESTISVISDNTFDSDYYYTAELEEGRIVSMLRYTPDSTDGPIIGFAYDDQGYCVSTSPEDDIYSSFNSSLVWEQGDMVYFDGDYTQTINYTPYENTVDCCNLDLNALLYGVSPAIALHDDPVDLLAAMRLFGKTSLHLTDTQLLLWDIGAMPAPGEEWRYYSTHERHILWTFADELVVRSTIEDFVTPMRENLTTGEVEVYGDSYTDRYVTELRYQ